jgi:hypothetical protein
MKTAKKIAAVRIELVNDAKELSAYETHSYAVL